MIQVIKRNSRGVEPFDPNKIVLAINKAAKRTSTSLTSDQVEDIIEHVLTELDDLVSIPVDRIHTEVENALMDLRLHNIAREYITYRHSHMPDILRPRLNYLPSEYPKYRKLTDALHHAFWIVGEFESGFTRDLQDFHQSSAHRQTVVKRTMLAIGQIEAIGVKMFWLKVAQIIPKPEIQEACITAANSEVVHAHAYTKGLQIFGVLDELTNISSYPPLMARQSYLVNKLDETKSDKKELLLKLILFSVFVESVSLFSEFLIMSEPNYVDNKFKTIAGIIQATSKEENLHYNLGLMIIDDLKRENPELFTEEVQQEILTKAKEALSTEEALIDWLFDYKDLPNLTIFEVKAYVHQRMATSLEPIGLTYEVPQQYKTVTPPTWLEDSLNLNIQPDFFDQRPTDYSKGMVSFTEDEDIF